MPTTAIQLFRELHGDNTEFLSKPSIIEFAEAWARRFYSQKILESQQINDSYFQSSSEEKRTKFPKNPPIQDLP